jgi:hypothetical protein
VSGNRWRRRGSLLALGVVVSLAHWGLAQLLPPLRLGEGSAEQMPKRIEVAYVRELAPTAPPTVAPVVVKRSRPRPRAVAAPQPPPAASAPEVIAESVTEALPPIVPPDPDALAQVLSPQPPSPAAEPGVEPAPPVASAPAVAASAASAAVAFEWPPSTRLSYTLNGNYRGEVRGSAQVEWAREGSRYQVHLDVWLGAQAAPLVGRRMTSDGELTDHGLVPRRYDEETRALFRELRQRTVRFEGEQVLLPNGKIGERLPGVQDAASQFVQLTWLFTTQPELLSVGRRIELPVALPTNVSLWVYEVVEKVSLNTMVGPVETYHLRPQRPQRASRDLVADVWFAPTLQYLPIRLLIRQDEETYIDLMIERLPEQAAAAAAQASAPR